MNDSALLKRHIIEARKRVIGEMYRDRVRKQNYQKRNVTVL